MEQTLPRVTVGFVNCNRLFYLKSCVESFIICAEDYANKEIIVVDNSSIEDGTSEYLEDLENRGFKVFRQTERDPANEYAKALNIIAENATGDFIASIPADVQFVVKGKWLHEYVKFLELYEDTTGCISFDAQRKIRNDNGKYSNLLGDDDFKFIYHYQRNPIMGAMNCMITKNTMDMMHPWDVDNHAHEGGKDSETKMLEKVANIILRNNSRIYYAAPTIPVSIGIFHEDGSNARVRGSKRYGTYKPPPGDETGIKYYEIINYEDLPEEWFSRTTPIHIEEISKSIGWNLPIDTAGKWIKAKESSYYEDLSQ